MPFVLRDYQHDTLEAIPNQWSRGYHSTLVNLFTGAGKTVIFVEYCKKYIDMSRQRALIITPAHLTMKTKFKFLEVYPDVYSKTVKVNGYKVAPAIGMEIGNISEPAGRITVSSADTLIDRVTQDTQTIVHEDIRVRDGGIFLSETSTRRYLVSRRVDEILKHGMIDELIIDECHHVLADSELTLVTRLWEICDALNKPRVKVSGYTATAFREDGKALGNVFQTICISRSSLWGQQKGYLAPLLLPIRVEAKIPYGRSKILSVGNWTEPIITAWLEKASSRPTIGFYDSVSSSVEATKKFQERGIRAAHIDGTQTIDADGNVHGIDYRETIFDKFIRGEVQVINNYAVILEGVDLPPASCMIWARPTENVVLLTQAVGRILRLFDGNDWLPAKTDALIIDIVGDDISVLTAGTLSGFKVDPNTKEYVKDEEDEMEVTTIMDGRDLRDTNNSLTQSDGVIYSVGQIIRKSQSDWYHDEISGVQSLGISLTEALIIVPPFFTFANRLSKAAEKMDKQMEASGNTDLLPEYNKIQKGIELYNNYTLWHSKSGRKEVDWVYEDVSLERLMDFAIPYMNDVSDPVNAFVSKKKPWKAEHMSEVQFKELQRLSDLLKKKVDPTLTKGQASQTITFYKHFYGNIRTTLADIYRSLQEYVK